MFKTLQLKVFDTDVLKVGTELHLRKYHEYDNDFYKDIYGKIISLNDSVITVEYNDSEHMWTCTEVVSLLDVESGRIEIIC